MNEILKQFTPNNIAGGSYERISIASFRIFLAMQQQTQIIEGD